LPRYFKVRREAFAMLDRQAAGTMAGEVDVRDFTDDEKAGIGAMAAGKNCWRP